jgi:hypothetical protein
MCTDFSRYFLLFWENGGSGICLENLADDFLWCEHNGLDSLVQEADGDVNYELGNQGTIAHYGWNR